MTHLFPKLPRSKDIEVTQQYSNTSAVCLTCLSIPKVEFYPMETTSDLADLISTLFLCINAVR